MLYQVSPPLLFKVTQFSYKPHHYLLQLTAYFHELCGSYGSISYDNGVSVKILSDAFLRGVKNKKSTSHYHISYSKLCKLFFYLCTMTRVWDSVSIKIIKTKKINYFYFIVYKYIIYMYIHIVFIYCN